MAPRRIVRHFPPCGSGSSISRYAPSASGLDGSGSSVSLVDRVDRADPVDPEQVPSG